MADKDTREKKGADLTRTHKLMGAVTFLVFLTLIILDGLPWYDLKWQHAALLFCAFLILLGFGKVLGKLAQAY